MATPGGPAPFIRTSNNTLDLRGQRVEDALIEAERFLDASVLANISPIMIIHGHGTGAVRNAVRNLLNESGYAKSFRPGESHEGANGVTIVILD
jgi:DNA mismatch repair protein MutS2